MILLMSWRILVDLLTLRRRNSRDRPEEVDSREALRQYMVREKPFLDPRLDQATLANAFGVTPRALSEMLREEGGFYEYINRLRVEEAQRVLSDPVERRTSIEAVSMLVGFRSRSTFYECFRHETGKTPAAWRNGQSSENVAR